MTDYRTRSLKRQKKNERTAKNFRAFVESKYANQLECAYALGISRSSVSHYCCGDAAVPTAVIHRMTILFPNEIKYYQYRELAKVVSDKKR